MCGRFALYQSESELLERFDALIGNWGRSEARYDVAPTQSIAVVQARDGERRLDALTWGLAPPWARRPLINIRADTLSDPSKGYFRAALARRCVIPASGFYEWREADSPAEGGKTPIYFHPADGGILGFAGVWDGETCAIVTTDPSPLAQLAHERMPVILNRAAEATWLDPGVTGAGVLSSLLVPYLEGMGAYPVGRGVNRPAHDGPDCVARQGAALGV